MQAGAEIVWVLEADTRLVPGTAEACREFVDGWGSTRGWCVGDGQTEPETGAWDDSPFAIGRGFDLIVERESMEIVWVSTHGTPDGNENLSGEDVLAEVRRHTGR